MSAEESKTATDFSPQAEGRLRRFALRLAAFLLVAFVLVFAWKWRERHELATASSEEMAREPLVNVVVAHGAGNGAAGTMTLPGETAAWFESTIFARVNGYVANWTADIGDHVRQGQVLATIETPELDAQLDAARAQINAAVAQVRVREAESELATTTYERWRDSPKGVVSDQEREEKKADFDSAVARLNAARAQVALEQAGVDRYLALTQFKRVTAPFDGLIIERRIDIGNLVTAGSTAATTPLYRVSQNRPMRVFVDAPQSVADELMAPGTPVQIRTNGASGPEIGGTVARTARAINPQARTLKVEVDLPNSDGRLVPGMYVDVSFRLPERGLVQVPAAALVFRSGGPQVAVVDPDGRLHFRPVSIARDDGAFVQLGSGVRDGDQVVLNVNSRIADGDRVATQVSSDPPSPAADPLRKKPG